jgi:hypothetical protein
MEQKLSKDQRSYIQKAIDFSPDKLLTIPVFIEVTGYEINKMFFDRFWTPLYTQKWLYLDGSVFEWLGYSTKSIRQSRDKFISHILEPNFEEGEDYLILDNSEFKNRYYDEEDELKEKLEDNPNIKWHKQKKHIMISVDAFKDCCMSLHTKKAKDIKKYYKYLEKLLFIYVIYGSDYAQLEAERSQKLLEEEKTKVKKAKRTIKKKKSEIEEKEKKLEEMSETIEEKDKQLEEEKKCAIHAKEMLKEMKHLESNEYIYVATNKQYASQNTFKIGKAVNCDGRLSSYNTGRTDDDEMKYVHTERVYSAKEVEALLKSLLKPFTMYSRKEMIMLHFDNLQEIIKIVCNATGLAVEKVNAMIDNHMDICSKNPMVFATFEEDEKNNNLNINIINIGSGITREQIERAIEVFISQKLKMEFSIERDKDREDLQIIQAKKTEIKNIVGKLFFGGKSTNVPRIELWKDLLIEIAKMIKCLNIR